MPQFDGFISFLDSRSFGTIWYWLAVIGMWSSSGRKIIGVPVEVLLRARHALSRDETDGPAMVALLNWLSLTLPRWRLGHREAVVILAATGFLMTSLAGLGFGYDLEMAQALTLLLLPFVILFWMRVRLARRLMPLLQDEHAERQLPAVAAEVVRCMNWHRRLVTLLSILAVAITALWGVLWSLMHPNGM
ncbi:hypothetical protein [Paracoccus alkanivorans]|uniref:Component of SufBCD complex n=1 Tax=Paracoccus alkanivorans TaxID=2116655 RepID=A0A3M0MFQ0_9RHOB|nr:hypothetical protein [Paracoccus alkanivorans]RMC36532.1 hypothetical protein C9E81_07710 [Paracoccus alkanivorans]